VRTHAACPSRWRDNRARAPHPFLFSCTRTRVDDYVSEVALPNVIADGELRPPRDGREAYPVLVFPFFLFFFLNSTSDVYLHAFKLHRRIRGSRGPKYRSDSLIQAASNPPRIHATLHLFTYVSEQTNPPQMRSLYLLLKKYFFFSSFGAAGRLTSRGLRHGIRGYWT